MLPLIELGRGNAALFGGWEKKVIFYKNNCLPWKFNIEYWICDYYTECIKYDILTHNISVFVCFLWKKQEKKM